MFDLRGGFQMKITGSQKKLYLLALALLMVAVALVCAWTLWGG